jgi:hypothetical protein
MVLLYIKLYSMTSESITKSIVCLRFEILLVSLLLAYGGIARKNTIWSPNIC